MPLKTHKPTTPSRRHMILSDFSDITKSQPERSLIRSKKEWLDAIVQVEFQ